MSKRLNRILNFNKYVSLREKKVGIKSTQCEKIILDNTKVNNYKKKYMYGKI